MVRCLGALGEYQEILPPLVKENGVELLLALLELTDTFVLFGTSTRRQPSEASHSMLTSVCLTCAHASRAPTDSLTFLNRLFAHKKFAHDFVDKGGLHALLQVLNSRTHRSHATHGH